MASAWEENEGTAVENCVECGAGPALLSGVEAPPAADRDATRLPDRERGLPDVAAGRAGAAGDEADGARDRERAARDRERAARDREEAASLRVEAARARAEADRERHSMGIDEVTGVSLRSIGLEVIEREIHRSRRTGRRLVLALVDLNNLEAVNDSNGHVAGDVLLRLVADMLGMELRSYDVIVRSGGDEFICTLENIEPEVARRRFEDILAKLETNGRPQPISFGLAVLAEDDDLERLVLRAGEALRTARGPSGHQAVAT